MKNLMLVAVGLLIAVSGAFAQPMMMGGKGPEHMIDRLKLTDQQQQDFSKIQADHQKKMIEQGAKVATARVDMQLLLKADAPQKAAIEKKMQEIAGLTTQFQTERLNHWFNVNKLLTPDQQKVWKKALEQPMAMGGRGQMGMHMRGGQAGMGCGMMQHEGQMQMKGKMQGRGMRHMEMMEKMEKEGSNEKKN